MTESNPRSSVQFQVLGSLQAEGAHGLLPLGGPLTHRALAVIILEIGHVVPIERIIDELWDDAPPATAIKQVRNVVSRLRLLLAKGGAHDLIETHLTGYRLKLPASNVDAFQFEEMASQARQAAEVGLLCDAALLLESALELWRGPFLAGLGGRVIATASITWNERRYAVTETYFDYQLALRRHHEIVARLSAFVAEHPLREKPIAQLMLALYRCGRKAEALALYRTCRAHVAEELGLDPSPTIQRLHEKILVDDPELQADSQSVSGHRSKASSASGGETEAWLLHDPPRQLPAHIPHFVGRQAELNVLTNLLEPTGNNGEAHARISIICGMPGIGKTALAIRWAHEIAKRFPDGQLYVDLRGYSSSGHPAHPADVLREVLGALGVPDDGCLPGTLDGLAGLYRTILATRRILLILDNALDADQVRALLPGSSQNFVIVTSRLDLRGLVAAEGAHRLHLGLLADREAKELMSGLVGAESVAAEPAAVTHVVQFCGGLPLALSLAAARAVSRPSLRLTSLAAQLADERNRLDVLAADNHASLRSAFSWSYRQLSSHAQRMFQLLGVHPVPEVSTCTAASLAGINIRSARRMLEELADAHMVSEHRQNRYEIHQMLYIYAAELVRERETSIDFRAAMQRMLDHYLHTAHRAALLLDPERKPLVLAGPQPDVIPERLTDRDQALTWFTAEHFALAAYTARASAEGLDSYEWQLQWTLEAFLHCQSSDQWLEARNHGTTRAVH